jgi:hypothetical protein
VGETLSFGDAEIEIVAVRHVGEHQ